MRRLVALFLQLPRRRGLQGCLIRRRTRRRLISIEPRRWRMCLINRSRLISIELRRRLMCLTSRRRLMRQGLQRGLVCLRHRRCRVGLRCRGCLILLASTCLLFIRQGRSRPLRRPSGPVSGIWLRGLRRSRGFLCLDRVVMGTLRRQSVLGRRWRRHTLAWILTRPFAVGSNMTTTIIIPGIGRRGRGLPLKGGWRRTSLLRYKRWLQSFREVIYTLLSGMIPIV